MHKNLKPLPIPVFAFLFSQAAYAQCPAVNDASNCGVVLTITNMGGSVTATGIGPYDGVDDALIGVVNNSSTAVTSINLTGAAPIFGFDGDGIDTYGIPGNSSDTTGYGGPNTYFSAISSDLMSGTVNFLTPIPPNGGIGYFSLEGAPTSTCNSILNNSVPKPVDGTPSLSTTFTPQQGYTLAQAAQICGFTDWDFQQTITNLPKPSPFCAKGNLLCNPRTFIGHFFTLTAPAAFNDPVIPHGYAYQDPSVCAQVDRTTGACTAYYQSDDPNLFPLYFNPGLPESNEWSLAFDYGQRTDSSLFWYDAPADPCLPGGAPKACYGGNAPFGSKISFTTHLVGLMGTYPNLTIVDTGVGFDWSSTFNGTTGATSVTSSPYPVDPGSGTGGTTVTNYNGIATLTGTGTTITAINGTPTGPQGMMPLPTLLPNKKHAYTDCNGIYGGTFTGDILVRPGQSCTFENASVNGNIVVVGGTVGLQGDSIAGAVIISDGGSFSVGGNTAIDGSFIVENAGKAGASSQICSGTIYGNLNISGNASNVLVGSSQSTCAGNVVARSLYVEDNLGQVSVYGNSVTKDVLALGNGGATDVSNNSVLGTLGCRKNKALSGSGNSAASKLGQCSTF